MSVVFYFLAVVVMLTLISISFWLFAIANTLTSLNNNIAAIFEDYVLPYMEKNKK